MGVAIKVSGFSIWLLAERDCFPASSQKQEASSRNRKSLNPQLVTLNPCT
jgi:hypothetical protein